ncbi:MAG TPA: GNAT family N-acetyltransferase [Gammaproteobacteria bacterium]|jgi:hypothetical protein|nr:GNAT family N-acetyltransferase [Gammaproteobacteria bacterium]
MKFERYRHWNQLPPSVDSLFNLAGNESMFLTREWFETLYAKTFKEGQSLLLASVQDKGNVVALLPLTGADERWQSFNHRYTALYSLLVVEENQAEILSCLAKGLSQIPVHSLQLNPVAEDDSNLLHLQQVMESSGYEFHRHFFFYNWFHRTRGQSFDQYMAERPTQLRNTIARKRRKLEREHEFDIRLFKGDEVQRGLLDYHAAYSASWKAYEQYVELLDAVAINLSKPDWTRLAVLTIDGKAAAAQLWFVVGVKASIFRLAYDEAWKRYSPGSILTAYLMQYVIDIDKVEEIDFLTGNEAYKQDWMSERRQRWRLVLVKPQKTQTKNIFRSAINIILR